MFFVLVNDHEAKLERSRGFFSPLINSTKRDIFLLMTIFQDPIPVSHNRNQRHKTFVRFFFTYIQIKVKFVYCRLN